MVFIYTAKLHYIEPQGTGVKGSIYPRFEISNINLFALIVARHLLLFDKTGSSKYRSSICGSFAVNSIAVVLSLLRLTDHLVNYVSIH